MPVDVTTILGRLLSESEFRESFFSDRGASIRDLDVSESTAAVLRQLDQAAIEFQASELLNKRLHEVAGLIPMTFHMLGENAEATFRNFAATYWPKGHQRHLIDAERFCRFVNKETPDLLCKAEWKSIEFELSQRRVSLQFFKDRESHKAKFTMLLQLKLPSEPAPVEYSWTLPAW